MQQTKKPEKFIKEEIAEELAIQYLYKLWPRGIAMNWFWLAFQALEKSGLTYYESDGEEQIVRERIVLLTIFYYEFCYKGGIHESCFFSYWDAETINQIKTDLGKNAVEELKEVFSSLLQYWKDEKNLFLELYLNCIQGRENRSLRVDSISEEHSIYYEDIVDFDVNMKDEYSWILNFKESFRSFDSFEGISI